MKGSARAPSRELVLRTPFATARTRPCSRVSRVTIRSASPSFWARRTTPSSRERLTPRLSPTTRAHEATDAPGGAAHCAGALDRRGSRRQDDERVPARARGLQQGGVRAPQRGLDLAAPHPRPPA